MFMNLKINKMIYKIKNILLIFLLFIIPIISFGDDPGPPPPPECPGPSAPPVGSPIEDGVPIILGLALFYGAFKLKKIQLKLKESEKNN
jgi:hypothetical protein